MLGAVAAAEADTAVVFKEEESTLTEARPELVGLPGLL